jgi:hypothetical protein
MKKYLHRHRAGFGPQLASPFRNDDPLRIWDERERLVAASPIMTKSWAYAVLSNDPENGTVKQPRRDARALSPAGMFGERSRSA